MGSKSLSSFSVATGTFSRVHTCSGHQRERSFEIGLIDVIEMTVAESARSRCYLPGSFARVDCWWKRNNSTSGARITSRDNEPIDSTAKDIRPRPIVTLFYRQWIENPVSKQQDWLKSKRLMPGSSCGQWWTTWSNGGRTDQWQNIRYKVVLRAPRGCSCSIRCDS